MTLRRLSILLALGGALAGARAAVERAPAPDRTLIVTLPADASLLEEAAAVREEVLVAEARRLGLDRTDPIVARHLVRAMRAAGATGDDDDLLEEAWRLGLDTTDPVVRERLLDRATRALVDDLEPGPGELEAWRTDHADRFRRPERVRFAHLFLSSDRDDADAVLALLSTQPPEEAATHGDPLLGLRPVDTATAARVGAWLGPDAASALATAPDGVWTGPIASPYGRHWFLVLGREAGEVPPLDAIEAEVRADWERAVAEARGRERIDALVAAWDVTVVRP